jgi:hypothetical protein
MSDIQVTCINKTPRSDTHHGITNLGGMGWRWTRQQVITAIEDGTHTFYTFGGGRRADIGVRAEPNGTKFVQTYADGIWTNNLLALDECRI